MLLSPGGPLQCSLVLKALNPSNGKRYALTKFVGLLGIGPAASIVAGLSRCQPDCGDPSSEVRHESRQGCLFQPSGTTSQTWKVKSRGRRRSAGGCPESLRFMAACAWSLERLLVELWKEFVSRKVTVAENICLQSRLPTVCTLSPSEPKAARLAGAGQSSLRTGTT